MNVVCDACGKDLTVCYEIKRHRYKLESELIPFGGGLCFDIHVSPPIEKDKFFCDIECLKIWSNQ